MSFTECEEPFKIVAQGRVGKFNRTKTYASWTLSPAAGNGTRLDYTFETEPGLWSDRVIEGFGARRRVKRSTAKALERLRKILEENGKRGPRTTVGGL
jgi:hypothetical protein